MCFRTARLAIVVTAIAVLLECLHQRHSKQLERRRCTSPRNVTGHATTPPPRFAATTESSFKASSTRLDAPHPHCATPLPTDRATTTPFDYFLVRAFARRGSNGEND